MEPLVSVSCLTYNHEKYIKNALDGFLMQKTDFPFEVVIHDDASTDGTQDIIREYERAYPNIFKVIYQKENQYSKTNSFVGISDFMTPLIRGKYIASCEGDDYWIDSSKLQTQIDYMEKNPGCSLTVHPVIWLDEKNNERVFDYDQLWLFERDFEGDDAIAPGSIPTPTCSRLYRTADVKNPPQFVLTADIGDFPAQCLLATRGYFHYFPKVMGVYRSGHSESWNHRFNNDKDFAVKNAFNFFKWLYEFNMYGNGKFAVSVGKNMLYFGVFRLEKFDAISEFPRLIEVIAEAHERKNELAELERLAKNSNDEATEKKRKAAEFKYYTWFVNAMGKIVKSEE